MKKMTERFSFGLNEVSRKKVKISVTRWSGETVFFGLLLGSTKGGKQFYQTSQWKARKRGK